MKAQVNWRITWYSVLVWFLAIVVSGFVILPWFYFVMPMVIFFSTIFYFKKPVMEIFESRKRKRQADRIFALGLWVALFWFAIMVVLNILEIIGPYYANVLFYFSDFRNWFLYPLILLIPVVYSLILENARFLKRKKSRHAKFPNFGSRFQAT